MPTNYPASNDSFSVPLAPEITPLSSAGSSSRDHVQSHEDLGDAIVAIQENAAVNTHNHNGGTSGGRSNGPKLAQANTHQLADTDTSASALHHTLGGGINQAAKGNHDHSGGTNGPNIPMSSVSGLSAALNRPAKTPFYAGYSSGSNMVVTRNSWFSPIYNPDTRVGSSTLGMRRTARNLIPLDSSSNPWPGVYSVSFETRISASNVIAAIFMNVDSYNADKQWGVGDENIPSGGFRWREVRGGDMSCIVVLPANLASKGFVFAVAQTTQDSAGAVRSPYLTTMEIVRLGDI